MSVMICRLLAKIVFHVMMFSVVDSLFYIVLVTRVQVVGGQAWLMQLEWMVCPLVW